MSSQQRRSAHRQGMPIWPILLSFVLFIASIIAFLYSARNTPVTKDPVYPTMDALGPVYTDDHTEIIKVYIFTDPDYGQQYLVTDHGGITPRIQE